MPGIPQAREDFFGPLAPTMPDEMLILAKQMAAFREEAASIAGRLASAVGEMEASFAALCDKNGWAIGK